MFDYLLPALFALFIWWSSTGVIIYLDGLPQHTFRWSVLGASALLVCSLYGLALSASDATAGGAYLAFTCGLMVWAWLEITFYMGALTGPRRIACAEGCRGWGHFVHALQVSLYHEIAIFVAAAAVATLTWTGPNQIGLWTFVVLWWMHQSARLNVFLGVPNLNEHFLPEHLRYLRSFFTKKPMNLLFPISVTVSTIVAALLVQTAAAAPAGSFEAVGFTFLAAIMVLAVIEHWFLVLPLPAEALWNWSMKSRAVVKPNDPSRAYAWLVQRRPAMVPVTVATIANSDLEQDPISQGLRLRDTSNGRQA